MLTQQIKFATKLLDANMTGIQHRNRGMSIKECEKVAVVWMNSEEEIRAYFCGVKGTNQQEFADLAKLVDDETGDIG